MTEICDEDWQQWLKDLSHPSDLMNEASLDLSVGGPEIDLDQAELLRFLAANPDEPDGSLTTDHIPWFSDDQWVPKEDTKTHSPLEQSIENMHRQVEKLQHELVIHCQVSEHN